MVVCFLIWILLLYSLIIPWGLERGSECQKKKGRERKEVTISFLSFPFLLVSSPLTRPLCELSKTGIGIINCSKRLFFGNQGCNSILAPKKRGNDDKKKKEDRKFEIVEYNIDAIDLRVRCPYRVLTTPRIRLIGKIYLGSHAPRVGEKKKKGDELMFLLFFSFSLDDPTQNGLLLQV